MNYSIEILEPVQGSDQTPDYNLILEFTTSAAPFFTPYFEIEIMEGRVSQLPNGMMRYELNVDSDKLSYLKKALAKILFNPSDN